MPFTRRALVAALASLTLFSPLLAHAQGGYPNKPIRVIVPFAAGSTTDIIARAIADKMSQSMGQQLVIDNRGGASGTIGQSAVAQAAPDGYTIMVHSSSHTVSPSTFAKLPFDTLGDFAGVTPISTTPNVLVIAPSKNIKTLPQLLAAARAKPGSMNFASAGQGSATHLNAEKFKHAAKIEATNIPFKGSGEAATEVMSGRVDYYFSPIAPVIGQIRNGQLVALAVGSRRRAGPDGRRHGRNASDADILERGPAADRGQGVAGARNRRNVARGKAARRADHGRGRRARLGIQLLDRNDGPRQDPARDRQPAAR
jgi:tripartite-type tricarboxylate transporter receptor subunit TctC